MFIRSFLASMLLLLPLHSMTIAHEESCLERFSDVQPIEPPLASTDEPEAISTAEMAWLPDGHCLVAAGRTGVGLYDLERPDNPLFIARSGRQSVANVAVKPNSSQIAFSVTQEPVVYLVDSEGTVRTQQAEGEAVTEIAYSSDGNLLAIASSDIDDDWGWPKDGRVQVWDLETDTELAFIPDITSAISRLVFSQNNQLLFIGGFRTMVPGEEVEYWDIASQSKVWSYPGILGSVEFSENEPMLIAAADAHDRHIALGGLYGYMNLNNFYGNAIHIWDTEQPELPAEIIVNNSNDARAGLNLVALAFNSDATKLASAMTNGTVQLWDVQSGNELAQFQIQSDRIWQLAFSSDGTLLAVVGASSEVYIWDVGRMEEFVVLNVG